MLSHRLLGGMNSWGQVDRSIGVDYMSMLKRGFLEQCLSLVLSLFIYGLQYPVLCEVTHVTGPLIRWAPNLGVDWYQAAKILAFSVTYHQYLSQFEVDFRQWLYTGVDGPTFMTSGPIYAYITGCYEVLPSLTYIWTEVPQRLTTLPGPRREPQSPPTRLCSEDLIPVNGDDDDDEDEEEDVEEELPRSPANSVQLYTIPSPPLPIPSPPPNSPTYIKIPESCLPLWKRVRFASPTPSPEVGESSVAGAARQDRPTIAREDPYSIAREDLYGFVDVVDVPPRCSTSRELDYDITDTWDDLETTNMYGIIEDAQDDRSQLRGRVNLLYRDRHVHRHLAVMIEREAKMAREAWGLSMDASEYARSEVMSLRTMVMAQSALILELQSADHRRQRVISELLASDHKRQERLVAAPRFGYVVAMLCSLLSIMGYSQLADCIDLLFCLATQYRSFVQKMAPKRRTTRLNPSATPTPVTDTHTTTSVTNAQIQAMINEGITAALAARDATRNGDDRGDDSHTLDTWYQMLLKIRLMEILLII
ncbi:hypothetical protein Tco_0637522 [Tanacetum coccineum]